MNALFRFLGVLGLVLCSSLAQAQGFPSKPITMIVPWPAGGSSDLHMRAFVEIASTLVYLNSEDYTKWAEKTFREERVLIERLGLLAK